MTKPENRILSEEQVLQIIKRIAYEIYEYNFEQKEVVLAGIVGQGQELAKMIGVELDEVAPDLIYSLVTIDIDKENPLSRDISISESANKLAGKSIVLIDDVLNSGRTLSYCLKILMEADVAKVQAAVLVDRSHKRFPLLANFKGYELSTTLDEHVEVRLEDEVGVYLF